MCELAVALAQATPVGTLAWRELAAAGSIVVAADSRLCPSSSPSPAAVRQLPLAYMTMSRALKGLWLRAKDRKPCTEMLRHQV